MIESKAEEQAMREKSGKRLVGWTEYAGTTVKKGANYSLAAVCGCAGWVSLLLGMALVFFTVPYMLSPSGRGNGDVSLQALLSSGCMIGIGIAMIWSARYLFKRGNKIEAVAPITRHNTGDLPEVETLVRASDLPPAHYQAELLRAAPQGSETAPEELLRASVPSGPAGRTDNA